MQKEGNFIPKLTMDFVISFIHGIISQLSQEKSQSSRSGAFFKCFWAGGLPISQQLQKKKKN